MPITIIKTCSKDISVKLTQTKTEFGHPLKIENHSKTYPRFLRYAHRYNTTSHQLNDIILDCDGYFSRSSLFFYDWPNTVTLPYAVLVISCCSKMIFEELILLAK